MKPSIKELTKIDGKPTSYSVNGIKLYSRIRVGQEVDLVLKNKKLKMFGQAHDEVLLTLDKRLKHHKANEDRITLED